MSIVSSNDVGRTLADALYLPKNTLWFELRVAVDEPVTIRLAFYPDLGDGKLGELVETLRTLPNIREVSALGATHRSYEKTE